MKTDRVLKSGSRLDLGLFAMAAALRLLIFRLTNIPRLLENRVELANSQIGIKAVREAIFLLERNLPIYQNRVMCQPSPLVVNAVRFFQWGRLDDVLFVALDLLAALLLWRVVESLRDRARRRQEKDVDPQQDYLPYTTTAM